MLSLWRPSSAEAAPMHDVEAVEHDEKVVSLAMEITDAGMQLSNSSTEAELFMIYSITGQLVKKSVWRQGARLWCRFRAAAMLSVAVSGQRRRWCADNEFIQLLSSYLHFSILKIHERV